MRRETCTEFFRLHVSHVDMFADPRLAGYRPVVRELGVVEVKQRGGGGGRGLHSSTFRLNVSAF